MEIFDLPLAGLKLIRPRLFPDSRGYFLETYHQKRFANVDLGGRFVQDNLSFSTRGVLRGLHYQYPTWQGKLVFAIQGEIFDVAVDIRRDSPTFGQWYGTVLNDQTHEQLFIPHGFAHGFCVLSETARVMYKCTDFYAPGEEHTLLWNDPALGIEWPVQQPILSDKDARGKTLQDALIPG